MKALWAQALASDCKSFERAPRTCDVRWAFLEALPGESADTIVASGVREEFVAQLSVLLARDGVEATAGPALEPGIGSALTASVCTESPGSRPSRWVGVGGVVVVPGSGLWTSAWYVRASKHRFHTGVDKQPWMR